MSVDLPAPLSPITREDLARIEVEVGMVERGDAAVALDEAARLRGSGWRSRSCRHPPDPLVDGDGDDDQDADGEFLPQHVEAGQSDRP